MAFYSKPDDFQGGPKKRTSIGDGLRKRGSFKKKSKKPYRGQGKWCQALALVDSTIAWTLWPVKPLATTAPAGAPTNPTTKRLIRLRWLLSKLNSSKNSKALPKPPV